ncbi:hypothetical protein N5K21_22345 [Rhizobium pusense]|uniref:Uncharacterized protein n=1 Tax=Agrobacterium pusense TaxID=648995 RepID=A0A6H0ZP39_9HYPH|nr:hypothetical protein [Agrobacterium pusense]MDH2091475.1 hypothetical protein [Agrobacterium pusense]QIX22615.1 hypothetical protein FOB41_16440 [Agrobacterium pusense]WCK24526.1 hypothetical protein CFBP5496_0002740 [Agrobacterium pusense]
MTQTPKEGTIAAMAKRKPGIKIAPLRPAALKPYQEAFIRELLAEEHEVVSVVVPSNGGYTYQRGVDAYMAKLSVDRLKEMAAQIDTAAAAEAELDRRADAFADWAKVIPFIERPDPEAKCRRVIGPDGLWVLEVGGGA